ncbi:PAS domain-containing protein [Hymenobacter sp. 15J16-1T3B]|uniref:PAS domain-containing protein n=1 Tax=Hymenobacter sp. 15J16-1T3B TaxID=2886941 RepID=UPI001D11FFFF|nr:PAS domain-containing protein [Hymenobacter sp. 15J16-1T3B]MCC3160786.1 PAS domain-containing protein [Hymenobacter sp. 15J16-1T3B]
MAEQAPSIDYQHLFRTLADNFLVIAPDAAATILDDTDRHAAAAMKSRAEVVGKPFFEAYPAADQNEADVIRESHEHVRRHKEPHTMPLIRYDLERPAEQGGGLEERYWQATHYPVLDAQGNLQYIVQRTQDVTEQHIAELRARQMQQELAESQERARFTLEALPIMVWTTSPDGELEYFNQRWLQYTGKTLAQLQGFAWADDIHPDDRARILDIWRQHLQSGQEVQLEYRLRRHDGHYRWIMAQGVPRRNADGHISMWVGGAYDIHEQKQMVQELLEANEQQAALSDQAYQAYQLAESQRETFYNLFMQAPALICILRGPEHRFDFVNPPYQQLFANRQLVGKTVVEALPEVIEQGFVDLLDRVYSTGETFYGNEIMIMLEQPDGSGQPLYLNFTYQLFSEGGQKAGITVFAYDVTSLVQARKALERLNTSSSN